MNEIIINEIALAIKEYNGKRVVTFRDIDEVHERPEGTARKRFNDNKERFVEGEDYFNVQMSEKRTLGFDIPNRGLTLITESGYYMLVKSFTDDLSWDVQRQLVKSYFRVQQNHSLSPMEMIAAMANSAVETERRLKEIEIKAAETSSKLDQALDIFTETLAEPDWKHCMNHRISTLCERYHLNHQKTRGDLYSELELIANCNLNSRVIRKKKRLRQAGAKYKDAQAVTKLDVIADDQKLKPIFDSIVKKLEARYIQGDNVQLGLVEIP